MAIWLGHGGGLRLQRRADSEFYVEVSAADVDVAAKRLSTEKAVNALITGDRVVVEGVSADGALLTTPLPFFAASAWTDGVSYPDGQWFVNVDAMGGIRFYHSWEDAIEGGSAKAVDLAAPAGATTVRLRLGLNADQDRCVAQTVSWTLDTDRETADITPLGEGFRQNQGVLVSGGGSLDCFFDALASDPCAEDVTEEEKSIYLHELVLRQEIGAVFRGVFVLKRSGELATGLKEVERRKELFYLCDCVITKVGSEVTTENVIHSHIDFVTTGPIKLVYSYTVDYLLQETAKVSDKVLQESGFGVVLEVPT